MRARGGRIAASALVFAVVVSGSVPAMSQVQPHREDIDVLSSANPAPPSTSVSDTAFETGSRSHARHVKADSAATATSTCLGCSADATTLQVVQLHKPTAATVDNVAAAWSTCDGCSSVALSVQVVLAHKARQLSANNRAAAVNAGCAGCTSNAVALQLVVATDSPKPMSHAERAELQQWVEQQASQLRSGPSTSQRRMLETAAPEELLDELDSVVGDLVRGTTIERDLATEVG